MKVLTKVLWFWKITTADVFPFAFSCRTSAIVIILDQKENLLTTFVPSTGTLVTNTIIFSTFFNLLLFSYVCILFCCCIYSKYCSKANQYTFVFHFYFILSEFKKTLISFIWEKLFLSVFWKWIYNWGSMCANMCIFSLFFKLLRQCFCWRARDRE